MFKIIPNTLSIFRLFGSFFVALLWLNGALDLSFYLALLLVLSDFVDGKFAYYFNVASNLGAKLDPVADKIFSLIVLTALYFTEDFSPYYITIVYLRNVSQLAAFPVVNWWAKIDFKVAPKLFPKIATSLILFIILILQASALLNLNIGLLIHYFIVVSAFMELLILLDFFWQTTRILQRKTDSYV